MTILNEALSVKELYKKYKKEINFANNNISCTFHSGEITALIGHNGAGKTTLLNQIVGLTRSTKGEVIFGDISFTQNPDLARENVSIMPQLHAPLKGVSVKQAVTAIGRLRGVPSKLLTEEVDYILEKLDIKKWENKTGEKLSGGLKRLTSFAMAVICPPKIILLDEPTNDVDPIRRKKLWAYLRELALKGHIVVIVTHNILEVEKFADKYYLFENGKIKNSGSVRELSINSKNIVRFFIETQQVLEDFPFEYSININGEVECKVDSKDIFKLFKWLSDKIYLNLISYYSVSTESLNDSYGELSL